MRIAFFVSTFPSLTETFIVNQVVDLKKNGYDVHIFSLSEGKMKSVQPAILTNGLLERTSFLDKLPNGRLAKIVFLLSKAIRSLNRKNLRIIALFLRKARKEGISVYEAAFYLDHPEFDIVHAHFGTNNNYVTKLKRIGLFAKSRFVATFHGYDLETKERELYHTLFHTAEVVTTNSNYSKQKLIGLGCPPQKLVKLPVGCDASLFYNPGNKGHRSEVLHILFVGRLVPFKAPDLVVRICANLKKRGCILFKASIVGEGEMWDELNLLIREHSLQAEVLLTGAKTQPEIRQLMEEADVFLYPGRTVSGRAENQGLVIQEAQGMGLPVIISDAGGMKEGIIDGETGFVVRENDINAFTEKIEWLAVNRALGTQMGEAGCQYVRKDFANDVLGQKLRAIYAGVGIVEPTA